MRKMLRKRWPWGLLVVVALIVTGFWLKQQPPRDPVYFTAEVRQRYETPQECFAQYVRALQTGGAVLYNEVLGYAGAQGGDIPLYQGETPEIAEVVVKGNRALIWTTNRWEVHLRYVGGRWVFVPESWQVLVQETLAGL